MRRLAVLLVCACALPVSAARAWTWPVDGPVLRPFSFDHAHPYAGGQHRGVDLGAPGGTQVLAPTGGIVSFAGTVPTGGKTVSIETPLGYTATLVHLGSIGVKRGAPVGEGSVVEPSARAACRSCTEPYVYFGLRTTSDQQGYVDPMIVLPSPTRPRRRPRRTLRPWRRSWAPPPPAEAPAAEPVVAATTAVTATTFLRRAWWAHPLRRRRSPRLSVARVEPSAAGAVAKVRPTSHARVDEEPGHSVSLGAAEVTLARVPVQVTQRDGLKDSAATPPTPVAGREPRQSAGGRAPRTASSTRRSKRLGSSRQ